MTNGQRGFAAADEVGWIHEDSTVVVPKRVSRSCAARRVNPETVW